MNKPITYMEIEKISQFKISVRSDDGFNKPIEMVFDNWESIPRANDLKKNKIDLSQLSGKLFVRFNEDGTINIVKKENNQP